MNTTPASIISEEDQQAFNNLAADFARGVLADFIHEYEYPYRLNPSDAIGKIVDLGFLSINLPADYGGLGLTSQPLAGILERISFIDAGIAGTLFANAAALEILSIASASASCVGIYEIIAKPGALPLAFQAFSDPHEASLPASEKKDGQYCITGTAGLLVSGGTASYAVIPAKSGDAQPSYFLINLDDREVTKSGPVLTIGMQSCRPVDIRLEGVKGLLIGKEGEGYLLYEEMSRRMSYPACGILLGIMKGSFNTALEYCGQRYQGGRMIIGWDDVRMKLAGMGSLMALAEACVCGLKSMFTSGARDAGTSAIPGAVHIGEMSAAVTSEGIQLLGGNGYMKDYGQEKRMRDAKQAQSLLGSSLLRKKRYIDNIINEHRDASN